MYSCIIQLLFIIFIVAESQKKWKYLRDSYRRKCITKSGQAATRSKPYIYADVLEFLRPTMQNRT